MYLRLKKKKKDGKRGCAKKDDTSVTALSSSCTSYHFFAHNFLLPCLTVTKPSDQIEINWPFLNHSETKSAGFAALLTELHLKSRQAMVFVEWLTQL